MVSRGHCEFLQNQDVSRSRADTVVSSASLHLQTERKREPRGKSRVQKVLTVSYPSPEQPGVGILAADSPRSCILLQERSCMTLPPETSGLVFSRVDNYILPGCKLHHPKATRHSSVRSAGRNSSAVLSHFFFPFVVHSVLSRIGRPCLQVSDWLHVVWNRCQAPVQALDKSLTCVCLLG